MKKLDISFDSIEPLIKQIGELTKVQRIAICCGAVVLILGVFVWFLYLPKYGDISKLNKEISAQKKTLKSAKQSAAQYTAYQKKMEDAQATFNVVSKALPQTDEVPALLKGISQVGKEAGLAFLLFQPESEIMKDFYAELPVTMKLSGSYHDLGVFFDHLAGLSRIVNIKKFDIKIPKSKTTDLDIACTAETYKFVESTPESKKEQAKKGKKKAKKKK